MSRQLFIYYKVEAHRLGEVAGTARKLQAQLMQEHPGLAASLLRRPETANGEVTVMETYAAREGVGPGLQQRIETVFSALRDSVSPRRVEVFEDLPAG